MQLTAVGAAATDSSSIGAIRRMTSHILSIMLAQSVASSAFSDALKPTTLLEIRFHAHFAVTRGFNEFQMCLLEYSCCGAVLPDIMCV